MKRLFRSYRGRPALPWRFLIVFTLLFGALWIKLNPTHAFVGAMVMTITFLVWTEKRHKRMIMERRFLLY